MNRLVSFVHSCRNLEGESSFTLLCRLHFHRGRVCRYTPEQVFDVVAGVDLYEDFVPWCLKSKVLWRTDHKMDAELEIGFKLFVEKYISHVELKPPSLIKVFYNLSTVIYFILFFR